MMPDTNDAIAQRRRLAQALMGQGTSTEPVGHWTQAAARVAQALSGSANMGYADSASKARETYDTQQADAKQGANRAYAEGAIQREVQQKAKLAQEAGLQPGSPEFKQYVYGIKPVEAAGSDLPSNVREYDYYRSLPDDKAREEYLRVKRSTPYLDVGTGFVAPNPINPAAPPTAVVSKDVAGAEREKVIGRETGDRHMAAPKAQAALQAADAKSQVVLKTLDEAEKMVGTLTAGFPGAVLSNLPGTAARDLSAKIDTLKANAGFAELQAMRDNSPTGGALGQVAVQELAMLQATITSLEQAQTPQQLTKAFQDYRTFIQESKVRRKLAFDMTYGGAQMPGIDVPQGGSDGWEEVDGVRMRVKR
jgi:hypothetical protein